MAGQQEQKFADLGDFKLVSGEVIRGCRIEYRTYGQLNSGNSNVTLFPTWGGGTTAQLESTITSRRSFDLSRYYVVAVDALGNGVSLPSNSSLQPRMKFPKFTIRDMVETQTRLLTEVLGISHVAVVMGISMGGMQTFEWMVAHPDFMDKAISIEGSPRLAPYDLMHWQTQIDAITNDPAWSGGGYVKNPARVAEAEFGALLLTTPEYFNAHTTREQVFKQLRAARTCTSGSDANNKIRQCQAMMAIGRYLGIRRIIGRGCRRCEGQSPGDRCQDGSRSDSGTGTRFCAATGRSDSGVEGELRPPRQQL